MTEKTDNTGTPAFDEIYRTYYERIVRYLSRTAGYDDAQDMAQEVFVKALHSIDSFNSRSSVYTWLYRIATNHLTDVMRKKKIIVDRCRLSDKELFCRTAPEYLTEEFRIVQNEMNECICSYIKTLPVRYRAIIILKEYEMMSVHEIADIMNISKEAAKKTLFRAKIRLREILKKQCDFYNNELHELSCEKK